MTGRNGADSCPSQTLRDPENGKVSPLWPLSLERVLGLYLSDDNYQASQQCQCIPQTGPYTHVVAGGGLREGETENGRGREARGGGGLTGPLPFPRAEGGTARPVAGGNGRVAGGCSIRYWRPPHLQGP